MTEIADSKELYLNKFFDDDSFGVSSRDSIILIANSEEMLRKKSKQDCIVYFSLKDNYAPGYNITCLSGSSVTSTQDAKICFMYIFNKQVLGVRLAKSRYLIFQLEKIEREGLNFCYYFKR